MAFRGRVGLTKEQIPLGRKTQRVRAKGLAKGRRR